MVTTSTLSSSTSTSTAVDSAAVRNFYDAVRDDDVSGALDALHPDVVLHVPGAHPLAGHHHGPQGVLGFVVGSRELTIDGERIDVLDVLSGQTHIAALCRVTGERPDGRVLDNRTIHLMRTDSDGRIVEIWLHNAQQGHVDAFWSTS